MPTLSEKTWSLSQAGANLPEQVYRLLRTIWSDERYTSLAPADFLRESETDTNGHEHALFRVYHEHYEQLAHTATPRRIRDPLHGAESKAVLVFDGMSVREVPAVLAAFREKGYDLAANGDDFALASFPTNTMSFIQQRFDVKQNPSQFVPGPKPSWAGHYFYRVEDCVNPIDPGPERLLLWCHWPDVYYTESEASGPNLFERICREITQAIHLLAPKFGGRDVIITSDHGYMYSGADLTWPLADGLLDENHTYNLYRNSTSGFGTGRMTENNPLFLAKQKHTLHRQLFERQVITRDKVSCIRGRFHQPGVARTSNVYVHGGWSWMELFVPWLELRHK